MARDPSSFPSMMESLPSSLPSIWTLRMCLLQNHLSLCITIPNLPNIPLLIFKVAWDEERDQQNLQRIGREQLTFRPPKQLQQLQLLSAFLELEEWLELEQVRLFLSHSLKGTIFLYLLLLQCVPRWPPPPPPAPWLPPAPVPRTLLQLPPAPQTLWMWMKWWTRF